MSLQAESSAIGQELPWHGQFDTFALGRSNVAVADVLGGLSRIEAEVAAQIHLHFQRRSNQQHKADSSGKMITPRRGRGLCHDEPKALSPDNARLMHVQRGVLWALPSALMVRRS